MTVVAMVGVTTKAATTTVVTTNGATTAVSVVTVATAVAKVTATAMATVATKMVAMVAGATATKAATTPTTAPTIARHLTPMANAGGNSNFDALGLPALKFEVLEVGLVVLVKINFGSGVGGLHAGVSSRCVANSPRPD